MTKYILAIDQGTSRTKAIVFDNFAKPIGTHQITLGQHFPKNGWVEHDPDDIWQSVISCCEIAIEKSNLKFSDITAIGITNQRETTIIWDKKSGKPIYPAIVWQDRRTASFCHQLNADHATAKLISDKTGLLIDPYFSATKIAWILDHVEGARKKAENGELAFGTIDSFLLWKLTAGKVHATDTTNASRTMLFNLSTQNWDADLLSLFNIPKAILPEVCDSNAAFGFTHKSIFNIEIPITGIAGDQQAASIGQGCLTSGMIKSTYGTGSFLLMNTGDQIIKSSHRLLSTVAYRINKKVSYGLEGSIFSAGSAIQWLVDTLKIIPKAEDTELMAEKVKDTNGVYFVPAFNGLGAPHWQPDARASLLGITRETNTNHIARAALESICFQTKDLISAMAADYAKEIKALKVDGGMVTNNWLLQCLADITGLSVKRPSCIQTTALGAAFLSGLGIGLYTDLNDINGLLTQYQIFTPKISTDESEAKYQGWHGAVKQVLLPCIEQEN